MSMLRSFFEIDADESLFDGLYLSLIHIQMCIRDSTGTDHTREYTPFIAYSKSMKENGRLEDQDTFAVIGDTIADNFGITMPEGTIGISLLSQLKQYN